MTTSQEELFYNSEPFDVACGIAREQLNLEEYLDRYLHIRDVKHGNGISIQNVSRRR